MEVKPPTGTVKATLGTLTLLAGKKRLKSVTSAKFEWKPEDLCVTCNHDYDFHFPPEKSSTGKCYYQESEQSEAWDIFKHCRCEKFIATKPA